MGFIATRRRTRAQCARYRAPYSQALTARMAAGARISPHFRRIRWIAGATAMHFKFHAQHASVRLFMGPSPDRRGVAGRAVCL